MRLLATLLIALTITGCAAPFAAAPMPTPEPTCAELAAPFRAEIDGLLREWDDALVVAGQTPRMQLSGQISALQTLRRRAEDLAAPPCAAPIQGLTVASMEQAVDGFLSFASGSDGEVLAQVQLDSAKRDLAAARHALAALPEHTAPIAPLSLSAVRAAYPELSWGEPVGDPGRQLIRANRPPFHLELTVDGEALITATAYSSGGPAELDAIRADLRDFLRHTLPAWEEADSWLTATVQPGLGATPAQTTMGLHTITAQRFGEGADQRFFVTVYLP